MLTAWTRTTNGGYISRIAIGNHLRKHLGIFSPRGRRPEAEISGGRPCASCHSPHRANIDRMIRMGVAYVDISAWLSGKNTPVTRAALARHAAHISEEPHLSARKPGPRPLPAPLIEAPERRQPITTRLRFAVLVRDDHTCRYCGRRAPDVELHVDHRIPVALGGDNSFDNLVTACKDCNLGKATAPLRTVDQVLRDRIAKLESMVASIEARVA